MPTAIVTPGLSPTPVWASNIITQYSNDWTPPDNWIPVPDADGSISATSTDITQTWIIARKLDDSAADYTLPATSSRWAANNLRIDRLALAWYLDKLEVTITFRRIKQDLASIYQESWSRPKDLTESNFLSSKWCTDYYIGSDGNPKPAYTNKTFGYISPARRRMMVSCLYLLARYPDATTSEQEAIRTSLTKYGPTSGVDTSFISQYLDTIDQYGNSMLLRGDVFTRTVRTLGWVTSSPGNMCPCEIPWATFVNLATATGSTLPMEAKYPLGYFNSWGAGWRVFVRSDNDRVAKVSQERVGVIGYVPEIIRETEFVLVRKIDNKRYPLYTGNNFSTWA